MSDADLIDTKHPWIDDPEDSPARMKWLESFFDPTGETSRVHFTRGWTALFFARLLFFIGTAAFVFIMMSAGAKNPQSFGAPPWAFPALVVITALMSLVLHVRRLTNAKRSPLWSVLVMVPVIIGLFGFMAGARNAVNNYGVATEVQALRDNGLKDKAIAIRLERPGAYELLAREILLMQERNLYVEAGEGSPVSADTLARTLLTDNAPLLSLLVAANLDLDAEQQASLRDALQAQIDKRRETPADADRNREAVGKDLRRVRKEWESKLPAINVHQVSERAHAVQAGLNRAQTFWALPAFFVMLWSLLWVGRLPNGGGPIRSRFEEVRPYEAG